MTNAKSNFFQRTLTAGAILAGAVLVSQSAMACTLNNWSDNSVTNIVAGDPSPGGGSIARYSGFCAMQVTGTGWVQDNNPGGATAPTTTQGIDRIVARFYVLNGNSSTAEIYTGYADADDPASDLFTVELNNAGLVTLTDSATGTSVQQSGSTDWLSIEVDWAQGTGNGVVSLSVNGQLVTENNTLNNEGNNLQSVRLGNLNGASGAMNFDAYQSRRSTAVGRLIACNAQDGDDVINILDALAVINELNEVELSSGTPDCTENGQVNILDVLEIVNIINT